MTSAWRTRTADSTITALGRLLARMALDEELHQRFLDDPEPVITGAGLSEPEEAALRQGEWAAIRELLGPRARPLPKERPSGTGGP